MRALNHNHAEKVNEKSTRPHPGRTPAAIILEQAIAEAYGDAVQEEEGVVVNKAEKVPRVWQMAFFKWRMHRLRCGR